MRIALFMCVVLCLAILGFGIHLVLEERREVMSFSATTTGVVTDTRVKVEAIEDYEHVRHDNFEPLVMFRYDVHGQQLTSDGVFRKPFVIAGNAGAAFVRATVDRYKLGQQVRVYYKPGEPTEACLIRCPALHPYLVVLGAVIPLCMLVSYWPSRQVECVPIRRRRSLWIAVLWHLAGLAGAAHYWSLAGADSSALATCMFGLYAFVGLLPVAAALPSEGISGRARFAIAISFAGAFLGLCLGGAAGCVAVLFGRTGDFIPHRWAASTAVVLAPLFALLGMAGRIRLAVSPHSRTEP